MFLMASSDWLGKQLTFKQTEVPCYSDSGTHKACKSRTATLTVVIFSIGLFQKKRSKVHRQSFVVNCRLVFY